MSVRRKTQTGHTREISPENRAGKQILKTSPEHRPAGAVIIKDGIIKEKSIVQKET